MYLFSETQKFRQWWLWFIIIGMNSAMFFYIASKVHLGKPFELISSDNLFIGFLALFLFCILFYFIKLETRISETGISARFFPIQLKFKTYKWDEIDQVYLRKYSPIGEYGGWGIRYSFSGKGRALNVSGRTGIQLVFKDGRKLLIGTSQNDKVNKVLSQLGINYTTDNNY